MSWRRGARVRVSIRVWIRVSRAIRIGICRAIVVRRRSARAASVGWVCGRLPLRWAILRVLLIRSLLRLIGPLLTLVRPLILIGLLRSLIGPLLIGVWPLILIWPLRRLIGPLLILVLPLVLLTILPVLKLNRTELPLWSSTVKSALAGRRDNAQAEEQDCPGHYRRTHSFRV
jgi:hypothetical protein